MTAVLEVVSQVVGGRIPEAHAKRVGEAIRAFDGKRVLISVKEMKKIRSLNQNAFYQGPFVEYIRQRLLECGHRLSHDDIHSGLRDTYAKNGYTIFLPDGSPFKVPPSTARLPTMEFEGYLDEIRADYAARFDWQLPYPNEHHFNQGE